MNCGSINMKGFYLASVMAICLVAIIWPVRCDLCESLPPKLDVSDIKIWCMINHQTKQIVTRNLTHINFGDWNILYRGQCNQHDPKCMIDECRNLEKKPVCANDRQTYSNECDLERQKRCNKRFTNDLKVACGDGSCVYAKCQNIVNCYYRRKHKQRE